MPFATMGSLRWPVIPAFSPEETNHKGPNTILFEVVGTYFVSPRFTFPSIHREERIAQSSSMFVNPILTSLPGISTRPTSSFKFLFP